MYGSCRIAETPEEPGVTHHEIHASTTETDEPDTASRESAVAIESKGCPPTRGDAIRNLLVTLGR